MPSALTVTTGAQLPASARLSEEALGYALQASAANTGRAYRAAWADFVAWCMEVRRQALPAAPETVGDFRPSAPPPTRPPA